ncbi:DUF7940 domain-containing protein [Methylobacterium iners]|uniref:Uncharacterized protein n=1 Tax=Methylobacterium iners TaxID=418707 RepID=A0ABQ4RRW0_9HYPH|nr:hypothetical protein [Methylobacterium iners]GJD92944.1 hypothetical protein OCOJLMKI_0127 [Methylobacterium iners]
MKLRHDWRALVRHAWSLRLSALATVLSGAEVAIGVFASDPPIPRGAFAALALFVTVAAGGARLVAQKPLSEDAE